MSEALLYPGIGTGALIALLGYVVVFFGLVLLLGVIVLMGRIMTRNSQKALAGAAEAPAPAPAAKPEAKGAAGELKLYNVPERDAALIMAIVAHRLGKPVNQLRFRSIKEVEDK